MAKSRSRSPRWKPRPLPYRSPERKRHRQFQDHYQDNDDFRRDSRRPIHWDEERHGQNNSKTAPYNRFNDKSHELDSFASDLRKSPFDAANRPKRTYSPERQGDGNRRFPTKYPEDPPHREHNRNVFNHRNQERTAHSDANGFKATRREDNFHRPYHREPDRDWRENENQWNHQAHTTPHYLPPPRRRSKEFVDRNSFQKRNLEDRDFREHEQPPKRTRETERLDCRPPPLNSHWKDDHAVRSFPEQNWSNDTDLRAPSPIVYQAPSGEFTKIEYDYSHRSPSYVKAEPTLLNERTEKRSWHEERKNIPARASQQSKSSDVISQEREKYTERPPEKSSKYNERKGHDRAIFKNDMDIKHPNHKHKERGRKEEEYQKKPTSPRPLRNQSPISPNQKVIPKISSEKETIMVNLALKKSTDNYRLPHEHWSISKDMQSKPEAARGERNYEGKQRLGVDMQKRNSAGSNERQMSQDLVAIGGKDDFRPVFEHLEFSKQSGINAPNNEFTQEIITIIHEVKANHFQSAEMSLHERFSKLQAESNKQDLNHNIPTPQTNPEIHRRIDISLEDLQNKSLHKTTTVTTVVQKVIEDPNDLRHDIERRRKQRLHSEEGSVTNVDYCESDATGSYYRSQSNETGEFQHSSRVSRPPFRKSGKPPGTYYRGKSNQFDTSRSHFENTDEIKRPYKGWGNPATRI
ncbi:BCLAF1 and THRAP3 family member 3 [Mixophyes fleayi]|uniref:BCLAF1 and THRAP3 family member 3 n=1 Tax=Mixophyes fleayi TaxID=3061075 RepID=UPI003F4DDB6B